MDSIEYQMRAHETAIYPYSIPQKLIPLWYTSLGLAGEAGELCNKIKKIARDNDGIISSEILQALKGELGGVMWYLAEICTVLGIHLEDVMAENIQTLAGRMERGTLHGSGDDR